jgi:hypothetical protein
MYPPVPSLVSVSYLVNASVPTPALCVFPSTLSFSIHPPQEVPHCHCAFTRETFASCTHHIKAQQSSMFRVSRPTRYDILMRYERLIATNTTALAPTHINTCDAGPLHGNLLGGYAVAAAIHVRIVDVVESDALLQAASGSVTSVDGSSGVLEHTVDDLAADTDLSLEHLSRGARHSSNVSADTPTHGRRGSLRPLCQLRTRVSTSTRRSRRFRGSGMCAAKDRLRRCRRSWNEISDATWL